MILGGQILIKSCFKARNLGRKSRFFQTVLKSHQSTRCEVPRKRFLFCILKSDEQGFRVWGLGLQGFTNNQNNQANNQSNQNNQANNQNNQANNQNNHLNNQNNQKTISEGFRVWGLGSASVRDINVNSINLIQREKKRALLRKMFGRSDPQEEQGGPKHFSEKRFCSFFSELN